MPGGKPPVILPLSALWAVLLPPGSLGGNIQALRPGPADALGGGETPNPRRLDGTAQVAKVVVTKAWWGWWGEKAGKEGIDTDMIARQWPMSRPGYGVGHGAIGASDLVGVKAQGKVPRTAGGVKEIGARDPISSRLRGQIFSDEGGKNLGVEYPEWCLVFRPVSWLTPTYNDGSSELMMSRVCAFGDSP